MGESIHPRPTTSPISRILSLHSTFSKTRFACLAIVLTFILSISLVIPHLFLSGSIANSHYHYHHVNRNTIHPSFYTTPQTWPQNTSFLDVWQASWDDHALLSTSPIGDFLPTALDKVTALQNPKSCANSSFLLFEYPSSLGFGAIAKHYVVALHAAFEARRVLIIDRSASFYWTQGCPSPNNGRHECYFRTLSETCPYDTVMQLVKSKQLPLVNMDAKNLPPENAPWPAIPKARKRAPNVVRIRPLKIPSSWFKNFLYGFAESKTAATFIRKTLRNLPTQVHKRYLTPDTHAKRSWLIVLAYYFLRLNPQTASDIRSQLQYLLKTERPVHERFVGLPIRASDKCHGNNLNEPGEMKCIPIAEVMQIAHRLALGESSLTKAIITSEDPSAITAEKIRDAQANITFHRPFDIVLNTLDDPAGTGAPRRMISSSSKATLLKASLVSLHLQSQAAFHILTPRSTFSSLIAAFAKTVPGKRYHTFLAIGEPNDLKNSLKSQFM